MDKFLEDISRKYVNEVIRCCLLMLKGLSLNSKRELISYGLKNQRGMFYLEKEYKYMFHGIGCKFEFDGNVIDWDFGCDDNWVGIDIRKLHHYINYNRGPDQDIVDLNWIKKEYVNATKQQQLIKRADRYYFCDTFQ